MVNILLLSCLSRVWCMLYFSYSADNSEENACFLKQLRLTVLLQGSAPICKHNTTQYKASQAECRPLTEQCVVHNSQHNWHVIVNNSR